MPADQASGAAASDPSAAWLLQFPSLLSPSSGQDTATGPPTLARTSSPPIHGASVYKRYLSRQSSSRGTSTPSSPRQPGSPSAGEPKARLVVCLFARVDNCHALCLQRPSSHSTWGTARMTACRSARKNGEPVAGCVVQPCRHGSGCDHLKSCRHSSCRCSRVDSANLNLRPDVDDQASFRSGSFK